MHPIVRHQGRVRLYGADSRDVLKTLPDNSVDSVSCDPPYALVSVIERFGSDDAAPAKFGTDGLYARASAGFMGQKWDTGETAFAVEFWREVLRVLKPGGHLAAFGGTRTQHHLVMAIEVAGFEIRDQLAWMYGTGFPKSHPQPDGSGTALKPAWEPIVLARKPLSEKTIAANIARWGTGGLWVAACRIPGAKPATTRGAGGQHGVFSALGAQGRIEDDGRGRFPANVLHDGSAEVLEFLPDGVGRFFYSAKASKADREEGLEHLPLAEGKTRRNFHPTVKPTPVMEWLNRLITPPGGVVLDPFMGSGSTGKAAILGGFEFIGIDAQPEFLPIAEARIAFAAGKALPPPPAEDTDESDTWDDTGEVRATPWDPSEELDFEGY